MNRTRQKINKELENLNNTINQLDLTTHRILHQTRAKYTFFSGEHGLFSMRDHMLGHKKSFNKFKKTKIIQSIFSDHSRIRNQ